MQRRSYPRAAKHVRTKMGETVLSHAIRNTLQDKKCSLSDWERFEKCHHFETGHNRRETLSVSVLSLSCAAKVSFHMFSKLNRGRKRFGIFRRLRADLAKLSDVFCSDNFDVIHSARKR